MKVLIIEDEPQLARHVARALTRNGHEVTVQLDGPSGLETAMKREPNLIVLDLNLPGMDGLQVLTNLRQAQNPARVLILTARGEVEHRIKGLKAGADDYLAKPFSMEELVARIEALGRRAANPNAGKTLQVAELHMDLQRRRVTRSGKTLSLSPREFEVLQVFMQEPGRVFSDRKSVV